MYTKSSLPILITLLFLLGCKPETKETKSRTERINIKPIALDTTRLQQTLDYCNKKQLNSKFAILVNLTQHSGNYRFFAVNPSKKDTLIRGLVTHGHCQQFEGRMATFSNVLGSNCTSEGKYVIGNKYTGMFGTAYKLHGLDSTNSNAFNRFVVLHSHSCVPDEEQEDDICASEGCPTVSPTILQQLEPYLDKAKKPVLLWIYKKLD